MAAAVVALLLGILNQLFTRLMTVAATDIEYDRAHHLHPGATFPAGDSTSFTGGPIELHLLPQETAWLAVVLLETSC